MRNALLQGNGGNKRDMLAYAASQAVVMHAQGFADEHIHADRVGTFDESYFVDGGGLGIYVDAPLVVKQDAIGVLHRGKAYTMAELEKRMDFVIRLKIAAREKRANFIVDCSPDIDGRAFRVALALRKKYEGKIDINVAIYPIFGLKTWNSDRWRHLEELAPKAQFIVGLPERDGRGDHPVGFEGHLGLLYELAQKHSIPLHVHVDQTNTPEECGTERLISVVRAMSLRIPPERRPKVSAVHMLVDAKSDEERVAIVSSLKELEMEVVCCPHAAISMRQMRSHTAPTHSSLAPVRELLVAGVPVRLGTDNTNDLLMPMPRLPLLAREMETLASSLRFYDTGVLWKLARGEPLNATDRASVAQNLARDYEAFGLPNPWLRFFS